MYYAWYIKYAIDTVPKTLLGDQPNVQFSEVCGAVQSTNTGASEPVVVTMTITDNNGATATATSGVGSQPPLFLRLFKCGLP